MPNTFPWALGIFLLDSVMQASSRSPTLTDSAAARAVQSWSILAGYEKTVVLSSTLHSPWYVNQQLLFPSQHRLRLPNKIFKSLACKEMEPVTPNVPIQPNAQEPPWCNPVSQFVLWLLPTTLSRLLVLWFCHESHWIVTSSIGTCIHSLCVKKTTRLTLIVCSMVTEKYF